MVYFARSSPWHLRLGIGIAMGVFMSLTDHIHAAQVMGFDVQVDSKLGHLVVSHDGTITWEQLQQIKNVVWGGHARAIEVYPVQANVLNKGNIRHLWLLGRNDFCPDLLGHPEEDDSLASRSVLAWAGVLS